MNAAMANFIGIHLLNDLVDPDLVEESKLTLESDCPEEKQIERLTNDQLQLHAEKAFSELPENEN